MTNTPEGSPVAMPMFSHPRLPQRRSIPTRSVTASRNRLSLAGTLLKGAQGNTAKPRNVIDLMAALRKSLGESPAAAQAPAAPAKRTRKAEDARKQPGLKLPIEGGKKENAGALAAKEAEPAIRRRRQA
jgi:hypothetical protein